MHKCWRWFLKSVCFSPETCHKIENRKSLIVTNLRQSETWHCITDLCHVCGFVLGTLIIEIKNTLYHPKIPFTRVGIHFRKYISICKREKLMFRCVSENWGYDLQWLQMITNSVIMNFFRIFFGTWGLILANRGGPDSFMYISKWCTKFELPKFF